jgi:hypothetical protein
MGRMKIRGRDLGECIWRLWLKGLGRTWRRLERYVSNSFHVSYSHPPFFTQISVAWIDADDRLIPHSDLVECNYSLTLYQPVSTNIDEKRIC